MRILASEKNLEAAGIGEDWERPIHKSVKAAGVGDDLHAGGNREMVSVAENNLRAHLDEFARVEGFHAGLCADRHEDGRFDCTVRSVQAAKPGPAGGILLN